MSLHKKLIMVRGAPRKVMGGKERGHGRGIATLGNLSNIKFPKSLSHFRGMILKIYETLLYNYKVTFHSFANYIVNNWISLRPLRWHP